MEASSKEKTNIEVTDDIQNFSLLDASNVPVAITLLRVGNFYIADPALEEEICVSSKLTVAVNSQGNVCSVQKSGKAGLHPSDLLKMLNVAIELSGRLLKHVDAVVQQQRTLEEGQADPNSYGFAPT